MNIITYILILILVIVVALLLNKYDELHKVKNAISFKESMDLIELPIVTFRIDGKKVNFLLDTGANDSVIHKGLLKTLPHTKCEEKAEVLAVNGETMITNIVKMKLSYKNNQYEESFRTADLIGIIKQIKSRSGVTLHGIIGNQFMEKYKYVLDFKDLIAYSKA